MADSGNPEFASSVATDLVEVIAKSFAAKD